jgi:hypothetical protein
MAQFVRENHRLFIQFLGDEPETLTANFRDADIYPKRGMTRQ